MSKEIDDFLNGREGPELVTPRPPEPYMSCRGCNYYTKSMACSGGLRGAPTYHKTCIHPEAWEKESMVGGGRSLTTGFGGEIEHKTVTPNWCPFLRKEEETKCIQ